MSVTMSEAFDYSMIDNILSEHGTSETAIIAILQSIQEDIIIFERSVSLSFKKLKVSEARIFSVATFYENFSLEPKGKYIIKSATERRAM